VGLNWRSGVRATAACLLASSSPLCRRFYFSLGRKKWTWFLFEQKSVESDDGREGDEVEEERVSAIDWAGCWVNGAQAQLSVTR
jgi:hypothetical protein